jgi:hypothetical protein
VEGGPQHDYSEHERALIARVARPASTSGALMSKVRAVEALIRLETPVNGERVRRELESVVAVGEELSTHQALQAAARAERLLDAFWRPDELDYWPEDPEAPATAEDYAWAGFDDELIDLYLAAEPTKGDIARWRQNVQGPPPWPRVG